jgi:hypothetical protein
MNELDFGDGTWDQAGGTVRSTLITLHRDVNGNGHAGLKEEVQSVTNSMDKFITEYRTREDERKQHEKHRDRNIYFMLTFISGVLLTLFGWFLTLQNGHHISLTAHTSMTTEANSAQIPYLWR